MNTVDADKIFWELREDGIYAKDTKIGTKLVDAGDSVEELQKIVSDHNKEIWKAIFGEESNGK